MDELAILVPVLRRPQNVRPLLRSIRKATPKPYRVLFIPDPEDWDELEALKRAKAEYLSVSGNYAKKINAAIEHTIEPLVFLGADDIHFHPGWFEAAKAKLSDKIGVVGTQDLCNARVIRGEHSTHFLMARWYADLGTIDSQEGPLFEGYPHEYVDNELVETAKFRNAWAFANESIVEHLHPDAGKAPMDDLYAQRRPRMRRGFRVFKSRRRLWTTSQLR